MDKQKITILNDMGEYQLFEFTEHEDHIALLNYISEDINKINIPAEINGKPVTVIGDNCFMGHTEITNVSFPKTLTKIGNCAFTFCKGIHELILPDSITDIGCHAFGDCRGLRGGKVVMPSSLKRLKTGVFSFSYMTGVDFKLNYGLEVIEAYAFYSAGGFDLKLPDSVKEIQTGAFAAFGPHVITSLPYDKGWYMEWPYGEKIIDSNGNIGVISDIKPIKGYCIILTVDMDNCSKTYFYPSVAEEKFSFVEEKNQKSMEKDMANMPDAIKIYNAWLRGFI